MSTIGNVGRRRTRCPRCDLPLAPVKSGESLLAGCGKCRGVWVDRTAFGSIFKQASQPRRLGVAREARGKRFSAAQSIKCPICYYWMDAKNFENCPELVVDVCQRHGTWLDANELHRILKFRAERKPHAITDGGATAAVGKSTAAATLAGAAIVSGALAAPGPVRQDRSPSERGANWTVEMLDLGDIGDIGELVTGVAEIGFSIFEGLG